MVSFKKKKKNTPSLEAELDKLKCFGMNNANECHNQRRSIAKRAASLGLRAV